MPRLQPVPTDARDPIRRISVIGTGMVGGSIALTARRAGCDVTVYDIDTETCRLAASNGFRVAESPAEAVDDAHAVFLAVPTDEIFTVAPMIRGSLRPGTIVTDVASVKGPLHGLPGLLGSTGADVILGHPMAGSQHTGFAAAKSDLFDGCVWLLCDAAGTTAAGRLAALLERLGAARILDCPSVSHDTLVAVASHFPQVAASALAASIGHAETTLANGALEIAGGGFRDSTRIAESPHAMWQPILRENSALLVMLLDDLASRLGDAARTLATGGSLEKLFADGNACRQTWRNTLPAAVQQRPEKTGDTPERWLDTTSGCHAWLDRTLAWETIRTTAKLPAEHALVTARYLARLLGDARNRDPVKELDTGAGHARAVSAALTERGLKCSYKETWTADGLHVEGVELPDGTFIVVT